MSAATPLLVATAACLALQGVLWGVARRVRNWSLVDPGWMACLVLAAALHAALGDGDPARRLVLVAAVAAWGLRHAVLLLVHRGVGRPEEGRYAALRARWSPAVFLGFFLAQGLLAALLSWPFLAVARHAGPGPAPAELAGLALFAVAAVGEAVADRQLAAWKADPAHRGRTCRAGLWAWSRHPNYFFEALVWVAFALAATPAPGGAWAWLCPATMLALLLFVTGVPPAEAQALRSRGDDYRAYQREVSAFVPWPPRRRAAP